MTVLHVRARLLASSCVAVLAAATPLIAGPREQAKKIFDRLTGVPPTEETLDQMEALVSQGRADEAAKIAMDSPFFYNLGLRTWVAPWTNIDENPMVPLNDYSATVIGMIRDDVPFNHVLTDDIIYVGADGSGATAYSPANNTHYQDLETKRIDLKANLVQKTQSTLTGIQQTAGVITTRSYGEAFFNMGTNRRAVRFALKTFLCSDMEQLSDTTRPDFRVRRDVDRSPGGDSTVFKNRCVGCHAGMDALAGAFAHYDFNAMTGLVFNPNAVVAKYNQNTDIFPDGYVTTNDTWMNLWTAGQNANVGWKGAISGTGAKSLGEMLTNTDAFGKCMSKRVFTKMCLRSPTTDADNAFVESAAGDFASANYNMKGLFAKVAVYCTGE